MFHIYKTRWSLQRAVFDATCAPVSLSGFWSVKVVMIQALPLLFKNQPEIVHGINALLCSWCFNECVFHVCLVFYCFVLFWTKIENGCLGGAWMFSCFVSAWAVVLVEPSRSIRQPRVKPKRDHFHSSGAVWKSRWPSWAVRPNEPYGFRGRKELLNRASALVTTCP